MATLGDLKARIIAETTRDDLADDLARSFTLIIQKAIDYYANERWWFNETRTTSACVIANEYAAIPTGTREIDRLFLVVGNARYDLTRRQMTEIEALYATPISGQPTDYAVFGANVRLWPTPNLAYSLIWETIADVAALTYTNDASSNYWTNEGQDLITGRAKVLLYRDYLSATASDPRIVNAVQQTAEAYARLKSETNRRISTGRVRPSW